MPITGRRKLFEPLLFQENAMIPMRDGIKLATDIYRPAIQGVPVEEKLPILFQRTPYNKKSERFVDEAKYFARHGYTVALQDLRGLYQSEGLFTKYMNEPEDGYDAIEWLAKLPYTDGKIGMWGTSYGAHVQANSAKLRPPHLKTIVLNCGGLYNGWEYKIRNHGALELAQQVGWAFSQILNETDDPLVKDLLKNEPVQDWFAALPLKKGLNPLSIAPNFEDYIFEMMTRGDYDGYWKQMSMNWAEYFDPTADIPMIHITGWYDSYTSGTIKNYLGLSRIKKSPIRLLIGPWTHGGNKLSYAGNAEFGPEAAIPEFSGNWHLRWFDHFLKGIHNGVEVEPAVRIFVMGTGDGHKDKNSRLFHGGYWKTGEKWPLPNTEFTKYYFHAGGALSQKSPEPRILPTTYTYDPDNPVPTIGGSFSPRRPLIEAGAYDQREREYKGDPGEGFYGSRPPYLPLKARHDVVVFQTEPLAEDLTVIGPIVVKLYASSTAVDTEFTAKLIDVYPLSKDYPSGYEMNITDGIIRARYRNSREKQEFMQPGEIYEFVIEPFPTANVFKKGHRIRLDLSSSNFPRFDVNPNTGEPLGRERRKMKADQSVYHDSAHPSHVILPIIAEK
jgi:hypothetical protein